MNAQVTTIVAPPAAKATLHIVLALLRELLLAGSAELLAFLPMQTLGVGLLGALDGFRAAYLGRRRLGCCCLAGSRRGLRRRRRGLPKGRARPKRANKDTKHEQLAHGARLSVDVQPEQQTPFG